MGALKEPSSRGMKSVVPGALGYHLFGISFSTLATPRSLILATW